MTHPIKQNENESSLEYEARVEAYLNDERYADREYARIYGFSAKRVGNRAEMPEQGKQAYWRAYDNR